jgi:hypothetical protein
LKKTLIIIFFFLTTAELWSQEPYSISINQTNGLNTNAVYDIYQSQKGFIWFATDIGLIKYDGVSFKTITSPELTSRAGSCIREDKYGRIWYENFDGFIYYVKDEIVKKFKVTETVNYIPYAIFNDYILIIQKNSIIAYDLKTFKKIKSFDIQDLTPEDGCQDEDNFYFISRHKLFKIDKNLTISIRDIKQFFSNTRLVFAANKKIALVSKFNEYKSLIDFGFSSKHFNKINLFEPKIIRGLNFIDNTFWIYSSNGIYTYENNKLKNWYFKEKNVSSVLKDKQGNFWIGTTNEGVFFVPNIQNKLYPFPNFNPNTIVKYKGQLLIASSRGNIYQYNKKLKNEKLVFNNTDLAEIYFSYLDTNNNNYFFSSKGCFIVPKLNFNQTDNIDLAVKDVVRLDQNYYAISTTGSNGIYKSPTFNSNFKSIWDDLYQQNKSLVLATFAPIAGLNNRGRSVTYNPSDSSIYFATNLGLFKVKTNSIQRIDLKKNPFYSSKLIVIDHRIFALSTTGDLFEIVNKNNFKPLNSFLRLKPEAIKLFKEIDSELYIISNNQIIVFNPKTNTYKTIDLNIESLIINDLMKDKDHLILLIENGILKIPLKGKTANSAFATLEINYLSVDNEVFKETELPPLEYDQNNITLNYSILDFGNSKPSPNYYKVNEEPWRLLNPKVNDIQFSSLSPGRYTIKFKNANREYDKSTYFRIKQPFWFTWWFILIAIGIFGAIIYLYNQWRISILSKQIILLEEKVELEQNLGKSILTSIKSQMNPHFFYNALNTIQAYIFSNDKKNASFYLGKFSKLTRMILEMSEKESIPLEEEIRALNLYLDLEKMRFDDDFNYHIKIDDEIDLDMVKIPSMLIQPYVENAIKHGLLHKNGNKELQININLTNKVLEVSVSDNGVGRKYAESLKTYKSNNHQSFSTEANLKRLTILNKYSSKKVAVIIKDKVADNLQPLGTTITLYIPTN